jgi:phosphoglycolate phosphatase-like HAD superfamily hydrolase
MARIGVGTKIFDVDMAVFDKDGTLIDFFHLWGHKARRAVDAVAAHFGGDAALAERLARSIGFDAASGRALPNSPLAVTSMPKIYTICAAVLYERGLDWNAAEDAAAKIFAPELGALPRPDLLRPVGDVAALFSRLVGAGVKIGVVTSDNRGASLETLRLLGVADLVGGLVCGDDPIANKPAPDALAALSRELGVPLARAMMVGDSLADMACGANAKVSCTVGVLGGTGTAAELTAAADAVLASLDEIRVLD